MGRSAAEGRRGDYMDRKIKNRSGRSWERVRLPRFTRKEFCPLY